MIVSSRLPDSAAVDLEKNFIRCRIRIDRLDLLTAIEFRLSDGSSFRRRVAFELPLFADAASNRIHPGEWTTVTFGLAEARVIGSPDLEALRYFGWYVEDSGEGQVVVEFTDIEVVPSPAEGIVSFTFDDRYVDQMAAAPILATFGFAATAYVMPRQIGTYGYLTPEHLSELAQDHGWEVSTHHAVPFTDFTRRDLENEVAYSKGILEELGFASSARHLAYPEGKQSSPIVMGVVRSSFDSGRLANGGPETLPPADWHLMRAVVITSDLSAQELARVVSRTKKYGGWAILSLHHLSVTPQRDSDYGLAEFEKLVRIIAASGVRVMTIGQVWAQYGEHIGVPQR